MVYIKKRSFIINPLYVIMIAFVIIIIIVVVAAASVAVHIPLR